MLCVGLKLILSFDIWHKDFREFIGYKLRKFYLKFIDLHFVMCMDVCVILCHVVAVEPPCILDDSVILAAGPKVS